MTLFPDYNENHWTKAHDGHWDGKIRDTHPGMASWAGETPNKNCGQCAFYMKHPRKINGNGSCKKAYAMGVLSKNTIPKEARACRYFDQSTEHKITELQQQNRIL